MSEDNTERNIQAIVSECFGWLDREASTEYLFRAGIKCYGAGIDSLRDDPRLSVTPEEFKAMREDAERYRWLRVEDNDELVVVSYLPRIYELTGFSHYLPRLGTLDKSIDAAMERNQ